MSRRRRVALALVGLAVLVYFVLTAPWQQDQDVSAGGTQRLLTEHKNLTRQLAPLERRAELRRRASALIDRNTSGRPSEDAVHAVRGGIVKALARNGGGRYRLDVRADNTGGLAVVSLSTEGPFFEMIDLISTLARPRSGLVVQQVSFSPNGPRVGLQIEAVALAGAP